MIQRHTYVCNLSHAQAHTGHSAESDEDFWLTCLQVNSTKRWLIRAYPRCHHLPLPGVKEQETKRMNGCAACDGRRAGDRCLDLLENSDAGGARQSRESGIGRQSQGKTGTRT